VTRRAKWLLGAGGALVLAGTGAAVTSSASRGNAAASAARTPPVFVDESPGRAAFGRPHRFGPHAGPRDDLAAAASYLGVTANELLTQLRAGKTLAEVADGTTGKSAAGLVAALVVHEKQELAAAVSAGRLTQAQADAISADLRQHIADRVNGVRAAAPRRGFGRHGPAGVLQAASSYLGITVSALLGDLQSGKTLAQVADATSGKSTAGLVAALVAHEKQKLEDAVSGGRLTRAQADAISANLQQHVSDLVNGVRPAHLGPGFDHHGPSDVLQAASSYLGLTVSALLGDLRAGKSLAQVAAATSGKSAAGLIAALVAHERQNLAEAVSAGRLTQAQADAISADLQQRITRLVNGVRPAGRRFGPRDGMFGGHRI
jgi:uncharacterized protein (DUF433 family)